MKIPGLKTVRRAGIWLHSRFYRHLLILGYHRIADVPDDPYGICVSPKNFAEQMAVLKRYARPLSLHSMDEWLQDRPSSRPGVIITFDDGYADLLSEAKPVLERYGFAAIAYIVTGCLGGQFWWDRLEQILSSPGSLPEELEWIAPGPSFKWKNRSTGSTGNGNQSRAKKELLFMLYGRLQNASPAERERAFSELETWAGYSPSASKLWPRALTAAELVQLAAGGIMEIGSHSVSHPRLPALPAASQLVEIQESKHALEKILGRTVIAFSYPDGSTSPETAALVAQAGYKYACTSENNVVSKNTDRLGLPRFWIPNITGEAFERWLKKWL